MMNISWQEFGVVGLILIFVYELWDKVLSKFVKGGGDNALENNTKAIMELTNFLKTQAAVDEQKAQQNEKEIGEIKSDVKTAITMLNTHMTQCQSTCLKR
jgi:hypothetical protein